MSDGQPLLRPLHDYDATDADCIRMLVTCSQLTTEQYCRAFKITPERLREIMEEDTNG